MSIGILLNRIGELVTAAKHAHQQGESCVQFVEPITSIIGKIERLNRDSSNSSRFKSC